MYYISGNLKQSNRLNHKKGNRRKKNIDRIEYKITE